jgi:hypothetical protein
VDVIWSTWWEVGQHSVKQWFNMRIHEVETARTQPRDRTIGSVRQPRDRTNEKQYNQETELTRLRQLNRYAMLKILDT